MGQKMTCPGCQLHSSNVLAAFHEGEPCPNCGLSAEAAFEIHTVRQSRADDALKQRVEELVKEADRWRRRAERAETVLFELGTALEQYEQESNGEG